MSSSNQPPVRKRAQLRRASTPPTTTGAAGRSLQTPSSQGFWRTAISSPGHATTPVAAAQSQAPSMTSFASANTYQTLDIATTDDESADLLTAPEIPMDLPAMVFPVEDVDLTAPEFPVNDVGGDKAPPPVDPGDTDVAFELPETQRYIVDHSFPPIE